MSDYRAEFLWGADEGTLNEAGYEFANGKTEEYLRDWWDEVVRRGTLFGMRRAAAVLRDDGYPGAADHVERAIRTSGLEAQR